MKDNGTNQEILNNDKNGRLLYHPPQLISLGQIQSLVQAGNSTGSDGTNATSSLS